VKDGEGLRRSHGDAAGAKLDAKLIDRFAVNTGTIPDRSRCLEPIQDGGIDTSSVEGAGCGRRPRSSPSVLMARTWRRGPASRQCEYRNIRSSRW
jgi:hypothetical protein